VALLHQAHDSTARTEAAESDVNVYRFPDSVYVDPAASCVSLEVWFSEILRPPVKSGCRQIQVIMAGRT